jgi:pilus assembly protein CpaE
MMIRCLGIADNDDIVQKFNAAFGQTGHSVVWHNTERELIKQLEHPEMTIAFLTESGSHDVFKQCRELSFHFPVLSIIVLLASGEADLKKAMRAGAADVISLSATDEEVTKAFKIIFSDVQEKAARLQVSAAKGTMPEGRVITICSTKGGVGKTLLSVNLAMALSKKNLKVVVLDLDLQFGDVSILFDVKPKRTIYEWIKERSSDPTVSIEPYLVPYEDNIHIFPAPHRPEFAEEITGQHIDTAIEILKQHYDWIVIDTSPFLVDTGLTALEKSDEILLITTMELPTIKNSKLFLDTMESLGLKSRVKLILNREIKTKGVTADTVHTIMGIPIYERIPYEDKVVIPSINEGIPFVKSHPRSSVAKSLYSLAQKLSSTTALVGTAITGK